MHFSVDPQSKFHHMLNDTLPGHCKMGGPRIDPKPSHRRTLNGKVNGKVTRVRTGCLTCRGRRKKCDERKPGCGNCERAGYHCEGLLVKNHRISKELGLLGKGYPAKLRWKEGRGIGGMGAESRPTQPSSQSDTLEMASGSMNSGTVRRKGVDEGTASYEVWSNQNSLSQQSPPVAPTYNADFAETTVLEDDGLETLYTPLAYSQHPLFPLESGSSYLPGGYKQLDNMAIVVNSTPLGVEYIRNVGDFNYHLPISRSLPYPIENIRTNAEKLFFYHFTEIFSHLLTTSNVTNVISPISEVVIPLAIKDRTVMKTILSLSGSHLLKGRNLKPEYDIERQRLHSSAVQIQKERKSRLIKWSKCEPGTRYVYTLEEQEILLATSLLLCLYELCEGSSDKSLKDHLDMARSSITIISTTSKDIQPSEAAEKITTDVHPLLLEFFNYHDSLAAVTIPTIQPRPQYISRHVAVEHNRISLIGDDLMRFMNRIAPLRAEPSIGIRVSRAASIQYDLENWKPDASFSKDHKMISEFYKWALMVWLFSILQPDNKADPGIQKEVPIITANMQDISDSMKACLLFPLFIAGGAAIREEDKETVRGLFRMLMKWSSLGNIEVALEVVEKMWINHDLGIAKSWDWVDQLQRYEQILLVT